MARILGLEFGKSSVRGAYIRTALKKIEVIGYYEKSYAEAIAEAARKNTLQETTAAENAPDGAAPNGDDSIPEAPEGVVLVEEAGSAAEAIRAAFDQAPEDAFIGGTGGGTPDGGTPGGGTPGGGTPGGGVPGGGAPEARPLAPHGSPGISGAPPPPPADAAGRPEDAPKDPAGQSDGRRLAAQALVASLDRPDRIVSVLPGEEASVRVVEIPAGAAKRIVEVLPFQLEELVPFAIDEAVVDHQPLEQVGTELRVLACATPKERVATFVGELADGGIFLRELAVGAAALDGLVPLKPELGTGEAVLLLRVCETTTDLTVLHNGSPVLCRTISEGAGSLERLIRTIKRTLTAHRASGGLMPVRAYLLGEASVDDQAAPWFGEQLDLSFENLTLPDAPGADSAVRGRFGTAMALACRMLGAKKRLDLLKGEFTARQTGSFLRQNASLLAVCLVAILLSFGFSMYARYALLSGEQDTLRAELERVTEAQFGRQTGRASRAREFLRGEGGDPDPLPKFDGWDVLDAVSGVIPESIEHNTRRFSFEMKENGAAGELLIQGTVSTVAERDTIQEALTNFECGWCPPKDEDGDEASLRCFQEVEGDTSVGRGGQSQNYQLEAKIRCPGTPAPESNRRGR
ncbi:MAG: hypothetical protein AAGF12_18090 [Myxococcota bacterium]